MDKKIVLVTITMLFCSANVSAIVKNQVVEFQKLDVSNVTEKYFADNVKYRYVNEAEIHLNRLRNGSETPLRDVIELEQLMTEGKLAYEDIGSDEVEITIIKFIVYSFEAQRYSAKLQNGSKTPFNDTFLLEELSKKAYLEERKLRMMLRLEEEP